MQQGLRKQALCFPLQDPSVWQIRFADLSCHIIEPNPALQVWAQVCPKATKYSEHEEGLTPVVSVSGNPTQ